jgi:hypothetical protein
MSIGEAMAEPLGRTALWISFPIGEAMVEPLGCTLDWIFSPTVRQWPNPGMHTGLDLFPQRRGNGRALG